ncbi:MAG: pyrroline-5-carboxylate reductase [Methanomicrobia archaeon]|nr:pyrroline-5-carboxylate reductase [Methanomicrobia archaeon]
MTGASVRGKKIGIIGVGNIGASILRGLLAAEHVSGPLFISDVRSERLELVAGEFKPRVLVCTSNLEVAERSDVILLAVKPQDVRAVLEGIAPVLGKDKLLITVAAGVPTKTIERVLGEGKRVIRVMPNIGALIGESVTALSKGTYADDADEAVAKAVLGAIGAVYTVKEHDIDIITGLSGSGIAFFAAVIDAMAAGGVCEGLPRELALAIAAQTAQGAAKLVLAGTTPVALQEMTASPGGTTMRGLYAMEARNVKAAMMHAVSAATKRARELSTSIE